MRRPGKGTMTAALVVIVDGCNESYVTPTEMPFVHGLKQEGSYVGMASIPTFDQGLALFTGRSPRSTDTFVAFCLAPHPAPMARLLWSRLPLGLHTGRLQIGWALSLLQTVRSGARSRVTGVSLLTALHYALTKTWVDLGCIPLALLPYLSVDRSIRLSQRKGRKGSHEHLFGMLKSQGFDVHFIYDSSEAVTRRMMLARKHSKRPVVWILHYGDSDKIGHQFGPSSENLKSALRAIDLSIQTIHELVADEIDFLVLVSDHGMVEVQHTFDLWRELQGLDARLFEDYIVFLNSPLARFWFRTNGAEIEIRKLLDRLDVYGRVVSAEERAARDLPTDSRYGDLIFWTQPGVSIWPNFYHQHPVRGMHTYFDHEDIVPFLLCHRQKDLALAGPAALTDVTPTILDLLGIPIPSVDGRSVLVRS
ncbi:alkaline phosphatase family protein [Chloroflexota bacterium]